MVKASVIIYCKQRNTFLDIVDSPPLPIFFKEVAEVLNAGGPPDHQKLGMIMKKHGLIPVVPKMRNA